MTPVSFLLHLLSWLAVQGHVHGQNIARLGKVTQSSLYGNAAPERAIDGNTASNWAQGSCTHTQNDHQPWWRLDLQNTYQINSVVITNRRDCCSQRLNGAEIHIGNSLSDNGNANPRCTVISSIAAGTSQSFACNGMVGRYVNIVIPRRREYLTLCEVEVYGIALPTTGPIGQNIARSGKVTQSSLYGNAAPERAIDGNTASNWPQGSCTHTQKDHQPWWRLDLQNTYQINSVIITNRRDCCSQRLNGAEIHIGNSLSDNGNANPRCTVISSIAAGTSQGFACNGMVGRYVNIVIPRRKEYLTLCEVEVYGIALPTTGPIGQNIARFGKVTQSSLYGNAAPERAIDGNTASNWPQGSCTHTQKDHQPWWRLDLQNTYQINSVIITNRRDCCSQRLNGAEIHIGNSLSDNGNANPRCTVISSIAAGTSQGFACNGMVGRYVNIAIPRRREYLTLCEVEVYGIALPTTGPIGQNIARSGKVTQSSLYGNAAPERAIDGNTASNWPQGSCTHTQKDHQPWWRLDLQNTYQINSVVITNRRDCCSQRLNGAEIHIGNSLSDNGNANPRCTVISSIAAGTSQGFACNGMVGRYVNIAIPRRREYLTLCEVEVYGIALPTTGPIGQNIARSGKVTQSSLYGNAAPERAIDGNTASNWPQGSCTHTQKDHQPWWRLDLQNTYQINSVVITNRRDCCSQRLNGAEIHIGNSLSDNGNANPRCTVISSIAAGTSQGFACNGMVGRYVNIAIPRRREYLTLCEVEVYGIALPTTGPIGQNIARSGKVTQSSLYGNAAPERAIDGNTASNWPQGSCTHTQKDHQPWWRLDLQNTYQINSVIITNRRDCCSQRLNGAEIHIGNSLSDNGNANPRCTVISSITAGTSQGFACNGMVGRYVNIVIPRRKEYLTLCEVEVYGIALPTTGPIGQNIARFGKVTQSSLYGNAAPERAIDGNTASNWPQGSCTHTQKDHRPWWRLDLQNTYQINSVVITNRRDCCSQRLNGAEIHIGNSLSDNGNANPRCAVISSITAGTSQGFACNGMVGRYVNIVIPRRKEYLTLCEVEVYGIALPTTGPTGQKIARLGKVTQSSLYGNAAPERAIDGNTASNWAQGSCTHTQKDYQPWWRLDLQETYQINSVIITNRRDCCSQRLNGAEIHIGNSLSDDGNANPRCAVISSIAAGASETFECNGMVGRYITIVIPGRHEYLTLCEVEVFGQEYDASEDACG
uniref:F5/8 type C domain-containing protein n=1 Tax=Sphaeramia orbicularis TaxID=375764 RepID=A0A673CUN9_9TELE